jgi:hypothetical protein
LKRVTLDLIYLIAIQQTLGSVMQSNQWTLPLELISELSIKALEK